MPMTKKNYEKAAQIVVKKRQAARKFLAGSDAFRNLYQASNAMEEGFVELFQDDNPRWDEEKFRFACNREVK